VASRSRFGNDCLPYLSLEEALALEDEDLEFAVFHHALHRIAEAASHAGSDEERLFALPGGLRPVYSTLAVEMHVLNGGFHQFFWNVPSPAVAEGAAVAYEEFGTPDVARLVRSALEAWQQEERGRQAGFKERVRALGSLQRFADSNAGTRLGGFDTPFYTAVAAERLTERRAAWVREHPEDCELDRLESCFKDFNACRLRSRD